MNLKYIIIAIISVLSILFYSCESNDSVTVSTYIPQEVNKKVMVEFFTNSGCTPCVEVHNYFDQVMGQGGVTINDTSVVLISYHYRFPFPGDSLYLANKPENDKRAQYYSIGFTPNVWLEGTYMGGFSASSYTELINNRMNSKKYADIILSNNYDEQFRTGNLAIDIKLISNLPTSDNKLFVLLSESDINYQGSNGISKFDDVMRDIITNPEGDNITLNSGNNSFNINYTVSNKNVDDNCELIVFVQSASTKEVYMTEKIHLK